MSSDKLWKTCKSCGKQNSKSARICSHCGAQTSGINWIPVALLVFIGIGTITTLSRTPTSTTSEGRIPIIGSTGSQSSADTRETTIELNIPEEQKNFISIINRYAERFSSATNELQQNALRDDRDRELSESLISGPRIEGWVGTITELRTNGDGKGILNISLSPKINISTWNNFISDAFDKTLIEKNSNLYKNIMNMSVGDVVVFSGSFVWDGTSLRDPNLGLRSILNNPTFIFRFSDVTYP